MPHFAPCDLCGVRRRWSTTNPMARDGSRICAECRGYLLGLTNERLIEDLARAGAILGGRPPTNGEMRAHHPFHMANKRTYGRRFGSWNKALELAGLSPNESHVMLSASAAARLPRSREQVTGKSVADHLPTTVKHFGTRTA